MTKVEDDDPPVAGRSSLEEPMARSKWSRRGRRMRIVLLTAWKLGSVDKLDSQIT